MAGMAATTTGQPASQQEVFQVKLWEKSFRPAVAVLKPDLKNPRMITIQKLAVKRATLESAVHAVVGALRGKWDKAVLDGGGGPYVEYVPLENGTYIDFGVKSAFRARVDLSEAQKELPPDLLAMFVQAFANLAGVVAGRTRDEDLREFAQAQLMHALRALLLEARPEGAKFDPPEPTPNKQYDEGEDSEETDDTSEEGEGSEGSEGSEDKPPGSNKKEGEPDDSNEEKDKEEYPPKKKLQPVPGDVQPAKQNDEKMKWPLFADYAGQTNTTQKFKVARKAEEASRGNALGTVNVRLPKDASSSKPSPGSARRPAAPQGKVVEPLGYNRGPTAMASQKQPATKPANPAIPESEKIQAWKGDLETPLPKQPVQPKPNEPAVPATVATGEEDDFAEPEYPTKRRLTKGASKETSSVMPPVSKTAFTNGIKDG